MKKTLIATALLTGLALTGAAHAYQAEVGGSYNYIDPDEGKGVSQFGVNGKYYFNPVQVRNSPLAESAFLDRGSNINADVKYGKNGDAKNTQYGVGAEYYVPNSDFYVSGNISRLELKDSEYSEKDKINFYRAEVGYLPAPGLLVAAGIRSYKLKDSDGDSAKGTDPTLRAKYVTKIGQNDVNFEASGVFGNHDNKQYYVGTDYYLDKTFSIGADYTKDKALDQSEWGLKAKKYIQPNLSVNARAGFGDEYNTYTVGATYFY